MATEKILIFDEAGNAKRMKVRIARFLDNEPVTASDKENIRTTLDVDDSLSGTFTTPLSVTSASDSSFTGGGNVGIGTSSPDAPIDCSGSTDNSEYAHFSNNNQRHLKLSSFSVGGNVNAGHDINASSSVGALSLSTGGSAAVTIDSSQRVGIGNTSPGSYNYAGDDLVVGNSSSATSTGVTIATVGGGVGSLLFADGTSGTAPYIGQVRYEHGSNQMVFTANANEAFRILPSGNILMTGGGGIDFGSTTTGSGTVTANGGLLSDYEEGTFTVTTAGDATGAISAQDGYYTKVGNLVTVRLTFVVSTTFTGNQVSGLPFLPQIAGASGVSSGTVALTSNINGSPVIAHASHLSSSIKFISGTNTGGAHVLNTTNSAYRLFMSYYTS